VGIHAVGEVIAHDAVVRILIAAVGCVTVAVAIVGAVLHSIRRHRDSAKAAHDASR